MKILLLFMPFGPMPWPSIGLSLLKAHAINLGIECDIQYLSIDYANIIGLDDYSKISSGQPEVELMLGEWIFSKALFPAEFDRQKNIKKIWSMMQVNRQLKKVDKNIYRRAEQYHEKSQFIIDDFFNNINFHNYDLVGFSSVFQQNVSSLALAKKIKQHHPDIQIAFGGSNCEEVMGYELIRQFPFIDMVINGEGDLSFVKVLKRLKENKPLTGIKGVYFRKTYGAEINPKFFIKNWTQPVVKMDELPYPNYDDYFNQIKKLKDKLPSSPMLLFETSRGCWWGQKSHCIFCGLNDYTMTFRSKSSSRAYDELHYLMNKYSISNIQVVDDIIDMRYFKDFLPRLRDDNSQINLFYETKSNLKKEQLKLMKESGIESFQPGIESLSTKTLKIIGKGVTGVQNITLLKWAKEYNVQPIWNILWGFPNERASFYHEQELLIPYLTHLPPPDSVARINIHRFSPIYDDNSSELKPVLSYYSIYPFDDHVVTNLAYLFNNSFTSRYIKDEELTGFKDAVELWKNTHHLAVLICCYVSHTMPIIIDTRIGRTTLVYRPNELSVIILRIFDKAKTMEVAINQLKKEYQNIYNEKEVLQTIGKLLELHYLIELDSRVLSLVIFSESIPLSIKKNVAEELMLNKKQGLPIQSKISVKKEFA